MSLIDANCLYELLDEKFNVDFNGMLPGTGAELLRMIPDSPTVDPVKRERSIIDTNVGNFAKPSTIMAGAATFGADVGADVMSGEQMMVCSECGRGIFWGKQTYCPNCGAYMKGEIEK